MPKPADHRVTVRFTGEEYRALCTLAGQQPLSHFIRGRVLPEASKRKPTHARRTNETKHIAQALALLGQNDLFRSVSRLSKAAEVGALPLDDETYTTLNTAFANVRAIRALLHKALGRRA